MFNEKLTKAIDLALTDSEKAFKLAKKCFEDSIVSKNNKFQYESMSVMAYACQFLGMYNESFGYSQDALNYFESESDEFGVAFNLNTLGFIYNYFEDHENRLIVNLKSLELRRKIGDRIGIYKSLNNTGDTYLRLKKPKNALKLFNECASFENEQDDRMRCVLYANLAETYFLLNDEQTAKIYIEKSQELAHKINFTSIIIINYLLVVKINLRVKEIKSAFTNLEIAEKHIEKNPNDLENNIELYKLYSEYYKQTKDYEKAYIYEFKINETIREKSKIKQSEEIKSIQTSYKLKKLETKKGQLESLVEKRTFELESTLNELKNQNNLNRRILNSEFHSIIVFDKTGQIVKFNSPAKKLLKLEHHKNLANFIAFRNQYEFSNLLKHLFKSNLEKHIKFSFEMESIGQEKTFILNVNFTAIVDNNETLGIAFLEDITYRVESEKQRKEDLEAEISINYFAQFLFTAVTVDEILWGVAKNCISRLGFIDCVIYLIDEKKNKLIQKAAYGNKNPESYVIKDPIEINIGDGIVGNVAKSGKYELINDTSKDDRYIIDDDIRYSEITIPIKIENKVIGVIDSEHPNKNFYTQKHVRILTTISNLIGNKIEKLKEQEEKEKLQAEVVLINETLENQVREKTNENLKLNKEIAEKEKVLLLGEMASLTSHELNTPLANIQSASEALIEKNLALNEHQSKDIENLFLEMGFNPELENIRGRKILRRNQDLIIENLEKLNKNLSPSSIELMSKYGMTTQECVRIITNSNNQETLLSNCANYIENKKFKHIIHKNIKTVSNILAEFKSLETLRNKNDENTSTFYLGQLIKKALFQTNLLKQINSSAIPSDAIKIVGSESKLLQFYIELFRIAEENIAINDLSTITVCENEHSSKRLIQVKFDKIQYSTSLFEKDFLYQNQNEIDTASKIRLRILNSILEEHQAVLKHNLSNESLIFTIEF